MNFKEDVDGVRAMMWPSFRLATLPLFLVAALAAGTALAQEDPRSTTGPTPPPGVVSTPLGKSDTGIMIANVPSYEWRHGCGPTALGMMVGFWDVNGFDDLIPGSASTQTVAVIQAIASGGDFPSPYPAGSEQHFEDYARPKDDEALLLQDDVAQQQRAPHTDNCIADFMRTSRYSANNFYGSSGAGDVIRAFTGYVALRSTKYVPTAQSYSFGSTLTFDVLKQEILAGRPMVFLVDSTGDGKTDHFVTVIGYDEGPPQSYIYYDTWKVHLGQPQEAQFRAMSSAYQWGVWGGWSFNLAVETTPPTGTIVINGNRSTTNTPNVTLTLTWSDGTGSGVSRMRFSDDGAHWPSPWEALMATKAYTLPSGDGYKTVSVQYLDKANNHSAVFKDYIRLDTTPPAGGIVINRGDAATISQSVTLGLTWADTGAGVTRMRFSDDGAHWTPWESLAAIRAHTLPLAVPGNQTVCAQYLDGAGNYSTVYKDYIKLVVPTPGKTETVMLPGNVPLVMVWIPGGTFLMGPYPGEQDSNGWEDPQHSVTLGGFWMGKYALTKRQWTAVMGTAPWTGQSCVLADLDSPAVYVSWSDAQSFLTTVNSYTGKTFRLPSEAQREYACRGGTTSRFYWGDDPGYTAIGNYAWYWNYSTEEYAHVVGQKLPNAFGLYDTSGNVWEWCEDDWHGNYTGAPTGGQAWVDSPRGSYRLLRGGSWDDYFYPCRSAARSFLTPGGTYSNGGFRVSRTP